MPPGAGGCHSGPSSAAHVFVIVSKTRAASATFSTAFITIASATRSLAKAAAVAMVRAVEKAAGAALVLLTMTKTRAAEDGPGWQPPAPGGKQQAVVRCYLSLTSVN